ncbi:MAG: hypothetical protein ACJ8GN_09735 [Longimicrobiaceae bacterium]
MPGRVGVHHGDPAHLAAFVQHVDDAPGVQVRQRHPGHGGERGLVLQRVGEAAADLGQEREAVAAFLRQVARSLGRAERGVLLRAGLR